MSAITNIFKKYPNPVFVETGSYIGNGIQFAIDAGFGTIYSIELNIGNYYHCWERFKDNSNVHLIFGDSCFMLEYLLCKIKSPVTFWLDGHSDHGTTDWIGKYKSPLIQELGIIRKHFIKTHIIIIDDLRHWSVNDYGFDTEILKQEILKINKSYKFTFEDGTTPKDILIAKT